MSPTAPHTPAPGSPGPRPTPSRCVWRSTSQVSPRPCSPAQLQAQYYFPRNPQINMCSYIFNREAVFIRVGISFTSFSSLHRRQPPLTRKMSRLMRERTKCGLGLVPPRPCQRGQGNTSGPAIPLQGAGVLPASCLWGQPCSPPPTPNTCWTSPPRKAPRGPSRPAPYLPPDKEPEEQGPAPVRGQRVEVTLNLAF